MTGVITSYQVFEYAIGHWLQKATEHVIGCVLCSPGCFSLFRASCLNTVLNKYNADPIETEHLIQYDLGEFINNKNATGTMLPTDEFRLH